MGRRRTSFIFVDHDMARVHGAVRQLCRGAGRRPQPRAGLRAPRYASAGHGEQVDRFRASRRVQPSKVPSARSAQGRSGARRGGRGHPGGRRGHGRCGVGRRECHHGRVGPRHPRIGRRFLLGHRWHTGSVGLDHRAGLRQSGRHLPRSHDLDGRGSEAPENAERNRPDHPVGRAHPGISGGHRDPPALLALQRADRKARCTHHDYGAGGPVGMPDSDHDRRAPVRHRRRGHEPHDAGERDRDLGSCGRGRRRRRYIIAGQDRNHHLGKPAGVGLLPGAAGDRRGARGRRATGVAGG